MDWRVARPGKRRNAGLNDEFRLHVRANAYPQISSAARSCHWLARRALWSLAAARALTRIVSLGSAVLGSEALQRELPRDLARARGLTNELQ